MIIWLNGTSSSGKTSISRALQDAAAVPLLHTGLDHFLDAFPKRFFSMNSREADAEWFRVVVQERATNDGAVDGPRLSSVSLGPSGLRFVTAMYKAIATITREGIDCIVDDTVYSNDAYHAARRAFDGIDVVSVGVRCSLDVAELREAQRGDRLPGGAATFDHVHENRVYDVEVDTTRTSPHECASKILTEIRRRGLLAGQPSGGPRS
jgi:chloramphenicol 3-O phosphotransferase